CLTLRAQVSHHHHAYGPRRNMAGPCTFCPRGCAWRCRQTRKVSGSNDMYWMGASAERGPAALFRSTFTTQTLLSVVSHSQDDSIKSIDFEKPSPERMRRGSKA